MSVFDRREGVPDGRLVARLFAAGADKVVVNSLAVLALCIGLVGDPDWLALAIAALALVLAAIFCIPVAPEQARAMELTDTFVAGRVLIVLLIADIFADRMGDGDWRPWLAGWVAALLMAMTIAAETAVMRVIRSAHPFMANHSEISVRNASPFPAGWIFWINTVTVVLFAGLAAIDAPEPVLLALASLAAVPSVVLFVDGLWRFRASRRADRQLRGLLTKWAPEFVVYWDAPAGTEYQLGMWLPYLERLDRRFLIVLRNEETFKSISAMTTVPVLFRRKAVDLDRVVVPSLKVAFYVNNAMRNSHLVRYVGLSHVQLNHGDSDKAPSFNPVFRMFDKNFVAGQAAIDRFAANGVRVTNDLFSIVGRPQVEGIQVGARAERSPGNLVVLYAPTWGGHNVDSDYSSLPIGRQIVQGLLDRNCTVIFRAHPYTDRNAAHGRQAAQIRELLAKDAASSKRPHIWNQVGRKKMSLIEHFNLSDALISDISSVAPDFLYSEKPFVLTVMNGSVEKFTEGLPIAKGAYLVEPSLATLDESLDALIKDDPLSDLRLKLKTYYLGDFTEGNYADGFLDEARRILS